MAETSSQTAHIQACLDRLRGGDEAARAELLGCACERLGQADLGSCHLLAQLQALEGINRLPIRGGGFPEPVLRYLGEPEAGNGPRRAVVVLGLGGSAQSALRGANR